MALIIADRVQEASSTTGIGSIALGGALTGYQSFSAAVGNNNTTYYTIVDQLTSANWEVGIGTYTTAGNALSRDTVLASSNAGSKVNFTSGSLYVFGDYPAGKAVTTDTLAYPPAIGGTTPAAGSFTTLIGGSGSANYGQLTGGATTKAVEFKSLGSDTNVSMAVRSQGTGAIDLAAGSSGVNVSNGGTVTAITRTAAGTAYTTNPTVTIAAPTTSGGVQTTATCTIGVITATVSAGGTGYLVGDVLTISGGTSTTAATVTVATLSGSAVATVTISNAGAYTAAPTNPASTTGGTGSGATFTLGFGVNTTFTITNAGSGYVEQPTVSFSGGGGSGTTAVAQIGASNVVRFLNDVLFYMPSGPALQIVDSALPGSGAYLQLGNSSASNAIQRVAGTGTNIGIYWLTKGTSGHFFTTSNSSSNIQFNVSHTASAVNYVQVTGGATAGIPTISAQGSDSFVSLSLVSKSGGDINLLTNSSSGWVRLRPNNTEVLRATGVASGVNYINVTGAAAGAAPSFSTVGPDTDIDLAFTPKGAGYVKFGTLTATADTAISGYIQIKDSGGTVRKLAVIT